MIAFVNGEYLPKEEACVSIDDRGLMYGDSVFEIARTFGGVVFRLDEHLERLRRSLRYVEMNDEKLMPVIREASEEIMLRNAEDIEAAGDVWLEQIVTRGLAADGDEALIGSGPTVIVKLRRLPFKRFAQFYDRGVDLNVSLLTIPFASGVDPRVKGANRLANSRADMKGERMHAKGGGHWTLIFNPDGSIAETNSANLCLVVEDRLVRPPRRQVLGGISLETVCELAAAIDLEVEERDITFYDIVNADETLLTATSVSILPVIAVDGISVRQPRTIYQKLLEAWIDLVGIDFVAQAKQRAGIDVAGVSPELIGVAEANG